MVNDRMGIKWILRVRDGKIHNHPNASNDKNRNRRPLRAIVFARLPQDCSKATATQTRQRILLEGPKWLPLSPNFKRGRMGQFHPCPQGFPRFLTLNSPPWRVGLGLNPLLLT